MRAHWMAFGIGIVAGAALGYWMGKPKGGAPAPGLGKGTKITGGFAAPFQSQIQRS